MSKKLLEIKNLTVQYVTDGEIVHAVNGISLTINKGESFGIVGETGAGKTTTALAILRLLPKYTGKIPSGEIFFHNNDILEKTDQEMQVIRGKHISMIFQDPMTSLNPVIPVGKQIAEVIHLHNKGMSKKAVNAKVGSILELVGIPSYRQTEYPHQFSGGMKQRVMISIAIACDPELLIADEPTTALDVTIQAQVINMMRELHHKMDASIILITHDLGIVANFCDTVAIMYSGQIVELGALEDIFDGSKPHHPYTIGLFSSIPKLTEETARLSPIPGLMPDPSNLPSGCKFHPRCFCHMDRCTTGAVPVYKDGRHEIMCHLYNPEQEKS